LRSGIKCHQIAIHFLPDLQQLIPFTLVHSSSAHHLVGTQ